MYQILVPHMCVYGVLKTALFVGKNKFFKHNIFSVKQSGVLFTTAHTKMPSKLSYLWLLFSIKHIVFISAALQGEKSLNLCFVYNSPSLQPQYIIFLYTFLLLQFMSHSAYILIFFIKHYLQQQKKYVD